MAPGVGGSVCTVGGTEALRTSLRYRTAAIRLASALGYAPQGSMGLLRFGLSDDAPDAAVTHASNLVEW